MCTQTPRSTFKNNETNTLFFPPHPGLVWPSAAEHVASLITLAIKAMAKGWWIMPELLPCRSCWGGGMRQLGCIWPAAADPGGHSQEGDIHHSDTTLTYAVQGRGWCMCVAPVTIQYYSTRSAPGSMKAQAGHFQLFSYWSIKLTEIFHSVWCCCYLN